jgi:hypothetical protein
MYTSVNFKTKKALKSAVTLWNDWVECVAIATDAKLPSALERTNYAHQIWSDRHPDKRIPQPIYAYQPGGLFGRPTDGRVTLAGPHYPDPHRWYAEAVLKDGIVISVK